eukprot:2826615-Amphidinium_carterae.1
MERSSDQKCYPGTFGLNLAHFLWEACRPTNNKQLSGLHHAPDKRPKEQSHPNLKMTSPMVGGGCTVSTCECECARDVCFLWGCTCACKLSTSVGGAVPVHLRRLRLKRPVWSKVAQANTATPATSDQFKAQ